MPERKCPDCGASLRRVAITVSGMPGWVLEYGDPEAKGNWVTGRLATDGRVEARLCSGCGRMFFYGVPKAAPDELVPAAAPEGQGSEPATPE